MVCILLVVNHSGIYWLMLQSTTVFIHFYWPNVSQRHYLRSGKQFSWIFFFLQIYFTFGCVGASLLHAGFLQLRRAGSTFCCSVRASHCSGFSCWGSRALDAWLLQLWCAGSVVVAHGLQSAGLVVVEHGLSCSVACGIFPAQGSNLCPLHWQVDS